MLSTLILQQTLASLFRYIERMDAEGNYAERNKSIYLALGFAAMLDYQVGFRFDPDEPDWPVAFIQLPLVSGQISWHLPQHEVPWDNHGTPTKYERIRSWVKSL